MTELVVYVNGRLMPRSEAVAELGESRISSAGGFYDAERTFNGSIFKLRAHLERLYGSLNFANIDPGMGIEEMEEATLEVLDANRSRLDKGDEFTLSQIVSQSGRSRNDDVPANILIFCEILDFSTFASSYVDGVRVITPITYAVPRQAPGNGAHEEPPAVYHLMTDQIGNITECMHANFMFVKGGRIKLPDRTNVLPGVSMDTVLEIAEAESVSVDEGEYTVRDVYECDEAFISSTRFCVLPVASLNGLQLGESAERPVTTQLTSAWSEMVGIDIVDQALGHLARESEAR